MSFAYTFPLSLTYRTSTEFSNLLGLSYTTHFSPIPHGFTFCVECRPHTMVIIIIFVFRRYKDHCKMDKIKIYSVVPKMRLDLISLDKL